MNKAKSKKVASQLVRQLICIGMVIIVLIPIILTLFAALKTKGDMIKTSPLLLPSWDRITFENFKNVLSDKYLLIGFKNTFIIAIVSIIFNVMLGSVTAFILERFE